MKVGVLGVMGAVGRLLLSLLLVSWEGRLFQVKLHTVSVVVVVVGC